MAENERSETLSRAPLSVGPPWIFGHRGAPLEAPENTLVGFERGLEIGLDGFAFEVRVAQGNEVVVFADTSVERTTDGHGHVAESTLQALSALDAGGPFDARFKGERIPVLEEVLAIAPLTLEHGAPQQLILVPERGDVARTVDVAREFARHASVRIASRVREACAEVRDLGLTPLWIIDEAGEHELEIARSERFAAVGAPVRSFVRNELIWPTERFGLEADAPADLLWACREPLHALVTNEPRRALAARALAQLAPQDRSPWPVQVPTLEVELGGAGALRGDWSGAWKVAARVRNPFGFAVRVACALVPRRGAFDITGLPQSFDLAVGEEREVPFELCGGSWRIGGDPVFVARLRWRAGPGRRAGEIDFDAPLARVRTVRADVLATRLVLLREGPRDAQASMSLRRHRQSMLVTVENPGDLRDARVVVHILGREYTGSRGVRVPLPDDFDTRLEAVPFSCALVAWQDGERVVRRFAGGIGPEIDRGSPGRLLPFAAEH
ncbi:MAG: hypothetical protein JNL28_01670 [Planctomycetes bacterium]|nr:hypothetical protein [Planctomycetota bacterium]